VETSASFEARHAPLSYPTAGGDQRWSSLPRQLATRQFENRPLRVGEVQVKITGEKSRAPLLSRCK
jgi:hypothetical protein